MRQLGVVTIGRNEGERLRACLRSVLPEAAVVVYVDSGSTDDSVPLAHALGALVVKLDMRTPFTAARARNAGYARLREVAPEVEFVQFVDGDCEVQPGWLAEATDYLRAHPEVAVASGRNAERDPQRSIYNLLYDIEWAGRSQSGEARACGGNAMMRVAAFEQAGGFRAGLIAGEEPELCVRLRAHGWRIWFLAAPMTLHDAAMTRFAQWWRRSMRTGYAYAEGAHLHGAPPERHWVRESRSAWLWGLGLPLALLALAFAAGPAWLAGFAVYPLQMLRLYRRGRPGGRKARALHAVFLVLSKFPEALGQLRFQHNRLMGRHGRLIEYK